MPFEPSGAALFAGTAAEFVEMAPASSLTAHLTRECSRRWGNATEYEVRSWRNSLTALADVLELYDLSTPGVGVELRLPLSSKRIDVSLIAHDGSHTPHAILVELKQWEHATPSNAPDNVEVGGEEKLHPSVQAAAYATYLRESHSAFTELGFRLSACAYLHNMSAQTASAIRTSHYAPAIHEAQLFTRGEEEQFGAFLREALQGGGGAALLPQIVNGRYSPSKRLIEGVAQSLSQSPVWTLLDEQRVAFNLVRGLASRAAKTREKAVLIVLGGPGTGKSVIAAHLVIALSKEGHRAVHSTASKAFTTNLRALGDSAASALFRWNFSFRHGETERDGLDVLVVDEAHRIRKTSNMRFTPRNLRSTIPQAQELIRAARVSVFLLDQRQNVRPDEIGSVEEIEEAAEAEGVSVRTVVLEGQFRCSGCAEYIEFIDRLFTDSPAPPGPWFPAREYDLRVLGSPEELDRAIRLEIQNGSSGRLVAGFCWPWSDPEPDGALKEDVEIGSWSRPWNEKPPEQRKPSKPAPPPHRHPYTLWATRTEGIDQVGCIYSAQGFEFDYCGVILGDDLVWRDSAGWVPQRSESHDPQISRLPRPNEVKALLQHTYRVLCTRGIKGTLIYSTDGPTQSFLKRLVGA
jgi:hypothetical protein